MNNRKWTPPPPNYDDYIRGIIAAPEQKQEAVLAGLQEMWAYVIACSANGYRLNPDNISVLKGTLGFLFGEKDNSSLLALQNGETNIENIVSPTQEMVRANGAEVGGFAAQLIKKKTVGEMLDILGNTRPFYGHDEGTFMLEKFKIGFTQHLRNYYKQQARAMGQASLDSGLPPL